MVGGGRCAGEHLLVGVEAGVSPMSSTMSATELQRRWGSIHRRAVHSGTGRIRRD